MKRPELMIAELIGVHRANTGEVLTIGVVESATGGRISDRLTNVPGSSAYFKGSIVAYSNEVKVGLLGVQRTTLDTFGAVSEQTALELARGGLRVLSADICISDTGIAGPSGAAPEKPAGLFYLGLATGDALSSEKHIFSGGREDNKERAAEAALIMLKHHLLGRVDCKQ